jgi:hypothetical protein
VVHRRAANSAAGKRRRNCLEIAHDKIMSWSGQKPPVAGLPQAGRDQKIAHVRIVLGATLE